MGLFTELIAPGRVCAMLDGAAGCTLWHWDFHTVLVSWGPQQAHQPAHLQAGSELLRLDTGWGLSSGLAGEPKEAGKVREHLCYRCLQT